MARFSFSSSKGRVRFAPNVSGSLHLGNARTALVAWKYARANGLRFDLRLDDDPIYRPVPGSKEEFEKGERENRIDEDLRWLGLEWDNVYRLSERTGLAYWFMDNYEEEIKGIPLLTYRHFKDFFLLDKNKSVMPSVITSFFDDVASGTVTHVRGTDLIPLELIERNLYFCGGDSLELPNYFYLPILGEFQNQWHKSLCNGVTIRSCMETGLDPEKVRDWLFNSLGLLDSNCVAPIVFRGAFTPFDPDDFKKNVEWNQEKC